MSSSLCLMYGGDGFKSVLHKLRINLLVWQAYSHEKRHLKAQSVVTMSDKNIQADSSLEAVFLIRKECRINSSYLDTVSGTICAADPLLVWKTARL